MKTKSKLFTIVLLLATVAGGSFLAAQSTTIASPPSAGTLPPREGRGLRVGQPHMVAALVSLQGARRELEQAEHDKGGYRELAIKSVDKAIEGVKAGIEYARTHPEEFPGRGGRGPRSEAPGGTITAPASPSVSS